MLLLIWSSNVQRLLQSAFKSDETLTEFNALAQVGMGLGLAQPKAQLIWAGPGRPKSALGRKILAQTHL